MIIKKLWEAVAFKPRATILGVVIGNWLVGRSLKTQRASVQLQREQLEVQRKRLQGLNSLVEATRKPPKPGPWQTAGSVATVVAVIVAILAVIVSIGVAVYAYRQAQNNAAQQDQASRYSSVSAQSLEVTKLIADHPRLADCFRKTDCPSDLSAEENRQAQEIAWLIADTYQYMHEQLIILGYGPQDGHFVLRQDPEAAQANENWITFSESMVSGIQYSKVVCDNLKEGSAAYADRFINAVASRGICVGLKPH